MDYQAKSKEDLIDELNALHMQYSQEIGYLNEKLKNTQEDLLASENKYRQLTDNMNDIIWELNLNLNFVYISSGIEKVTGFVPSEMIGKNLLHFVEPRNAETLKNTFATRLNTFNENGDLESTLFKHHQVCKNGDYKWLEALSNPIVNENGKIIGFKGISRDISFQERADEALKLSEDKLSKVFHSAPYVITIIRVSDLKLVEINLVAEEIFGYSRDEFLKIPSIEKQIWVDPARRDKYINSIKELQTLKNFEFQFLTKNAKIGTALMTTEYLTVDHELCVLASFEVITQRKEAELLLKEKSQEIAAQNLEYSQLNKELLKTNEDLVKAKEEAEESNRLKTAFLQNMSHEIRTPMNAIMGFSSLLAEQYNNKSKLELFADIINQRCSDLLGIIDDILDIAKIESGLLSINIEECDLNIMFLEILSFFKEHQKRMAKDRINFNLFSLPDPEENRIMTDSGKLKQIFINLIGNAFKFTESGSIEAGCSLENETGFMDEIPKKYLKFYIKDTGIGIRPEQQRRIFERFVQVQNNPQKLQRGTGLGLSIVKGLVEIMKGNIWLESEAGKGSIFYFTIPYVPVDFNIAKIVLPTHTHPYKLQGIKILVVEDDIYNSEYLQEILKNAGFETIFTEFGQEAIQLVNRNHYDIVLMDIRLPDMDGFEITRQMIKLKPNLKVIAQTAFASDDDRKKTIEAGCVDFISKPVKKEDLFALIEKYH